MRHGDPGLSANKIKAKVQFIFLVLCMLMLSSCASCKLKIKEDYQYWRNQKTPDKRKFDKFKCFPLFRLIHWLPSIHH